MRNTDTPTKGAGVQVYQRKSSLYSVPSVRGSFSHLQPPKINVSPATNNNKGTAPSLPFYKLFCFATWVEYIAMGIALIASIIMGGCLPAILISYGEFAMLLSERVAPRGPSSTTLIISAFGGGRLIVNGTESERLEAIMEDTVGYGIGCAIATTLLLVSGIITLDLINFTAARQIHRIREKFLKSVLRQEISWFDTNTNMNFASKVSEDLEKLKEGIGEKIGIFAYLVASCTLCIVVAFVYGWKLTLVVLSTSPIIIITTAIVAKIQSNLTRRELQAYSTAGVIADEVLSSIRTVIAFGGENKEVERYTEELKPAEITGCRKGLYSGIGSGTLWFITYITYAIAFYYGVLLIIDDRDKDVKEYTPAVIMIVFFGVLTAALNLGLALPHLESFGVACSSAQEIFSIINRVSAIDGLSDEGLKPNNVRGEIKFSGVHFQYPSRTSVKVLQGLNLVVKPGKIVALVGPSGCGKSTCLQLIQRLYDPKRGSISLDGEDIKNINVKWLRKHIGVVGQEPILFNTTIKENIKYGSQDCSEADIVAAAKSANCHDFISSLPNGYNTMVGERGAQLSGGQKQRIAIARALVRNPKVLLLDEATSALDLQSEGKVQKALDAASKGRTTIVVTHRLSTITNADLIVYMDKGGIAEMGTHVDLIKSKGFYYNLVMANVQSEEENKGEETDDEEEYVELKSVSIDSNKISTTSLDKSKTEEATDAPSASMWRILKLNAPEWKLILFGSIASIVVGAMFPAFAIVFGEFYGVLVEDDEDFIKQQILTFSLYFVLIGVLSGFGTFAQIYLLNVSGAKLTSRLRKMAFSHMLKQDMGWYDDDKNSVGALGVRLAGDCSGVQGATGTHVGCILQSFSTLFIGVLISFFYSWKMTLVTCATMPVIFVTIYFESLFTEGEGVKEKNAMEKSSQIATEAITNIRTVASLCQEESLLLRYMKEIEEVSKSTMKKQRLRGIVYSLGQCIPYYGYALSLYYGGVLIANKEIAHQDVIRVSECLIFGAWMIGQALAFAPNFNGAKLSASRLFRLFDRNTAVTDPTSKTINESWKADGDISYSKVEFHYPTRPEVNVLQGLTLDINRGKTVALVGHSGCGKSTCVQLIQRLYDPSEGSVSIDGHNIAADMTLSKLRSQLSIVSQEPVLFDRTIADNIAYGDNSRSVLMDEIIDAARSSNIHEFIKALPLGYETRLGTKGTQLSGGQKQRIAIARALIRNPRILLLDEATSALDTQSENIVQQALDKACEGRTCIVIAHRLSTIRNADVICVLNNGDVVESGSHEQLLKLGGLYYQMHALQTLSIDSID